MTPEKWEIISRIFNEAALLKEVERRRFVEEECAGDPSLISEINSLLSAHEEVGDFIADPIVENLVGEISEMPTLTGKYIGHYRIERSIGRGGMGDVYLATDTRLDRLVALKRLPERLLADPLFVKRFQTEAKAAATINHPNVATLFSVEEVEGRPFITMEYVEGHLLDSITPPEGMSVNRFLDIFSQIADAIGHAHSRGVIHRDIKPGNIMIMADGTPKILDFGLAQFADDSNTGPMGTAITQPGQILGTPSYMSPEQAQGKDVDHRSDIFSLGVVMYETLTGRRPFTGDNNAELISNLLKSNAAAVMELRPDVPGMISRLVSECMQKRRNDRPQEMRQVQNALGESKRLVRSGTSTGSFARRLYKESVSVGPWLRVLPILLVILLATAAWFYFSKSGNDSQFAFEDMAMRRLSDTNNIGYAQISPDGKSIAFATFEPDGSRALWIRRIEDRNTLTLVPPEQQQYWGGLAFSPDGGQVFYITADRIGTHGSMFRVSTLGGPPRKLTDLANDVGGISPDGERILFVRYGDPSQIISMNTSDGSGEEVIETGRSDGLTGSNFRDPQYSHDGHSIYYIKYDINEGVEQWSLEEKNLDTGNTRSIYKQPDRISELAVLPESRSVLVAAIDPVSNLQQIFEISTYDGAKSRVTNDLFFYFGVSVDRTGKNVVVSQRSSEQRVWIGDAADLNSLKPLNQELNANRNLDWTPDGRLIYDGFENNISHVWIADIDGKNLQQLTSSETEDFRPRVSGDGRFVVFTSQRSGRSQVWRMGIDGNDRVLLADVSGVTQLPEFGADGQTVFFEWLYERNRIWASIPVTGGAVTEVRRLDDIPANNLFYWAASPDGRFIAQSIWDKGENRMRIAVDAVDSSAERKVLNIWPSLIFRWSPDSKSIYYRERQVGYVPENEVLKVDILTGKSTQLVSAAPEFIVDMAYSRDGKKVAIVRGRNTSNFVMLTPAHAK